MTRRYRYPLQALQDLRGAEVDAARAALTLVQQRIAANERDMASCSATMRELEQALRQARSGGRLDPEGHRASYAYLSHLRERQAMLRQARLPLLQQEQQGLRQLTAARGARRMLDKHHERLADAHLQEVARAGQREADDSWLAVANQRSGRQ